MSTDQLGSVRRADHPGQKPFRSRALYKYRELYLMALPGLILLLLFLYLPNFWVVVAFQNYSPVRGITDSPFVGFDHFISAFTSIRFWRAFRNTIVLSVMRLSLSIPVPVILALALNEMRSSLLKRLTQTITILPHFFSTVIVASIAVLFLQPSGPLNHLLTSVGLVERPIVFSQIGPAFKPIVVLLEIWKETGWWSVIYLAAIVGIDPGLYEAATIDGANRIQKIWHVTLPNILFSMAVMLVLKSGTIMRTGWETILLLYNSTIYEHADVLETYMYRIGLVQGQFSFAYAVSLFQQIIAMGLLWLSHQASKRMTEGGVL
jgi:putative aldouronate transport system permease protein